MSLQLCEYYGKHDSKWSLSSKCPNAATVLSTALSTGYNNRVFTLCDVHHKSAHDKYGYIIVGIVNQKKCRRNATTTV